MDINAQKTEPAIDVIRTGTDGQPQFTERQVEALKILGRCFRCGEDKHLANKCTKFPPPARMSGVTSSFRGRGQNWQAGGRPQNTGPCTNTQQVDLEDLEKQGKQFKAIAMTLDPDERADFVESFLGPDF